MATTLPFIVSDDGKFFLKDDSNRFYITIDGSVVPVPTPGANVVYIFQNAGNDPIVAALQIALVTVFNLAVSSIVPLPGIWVMAVQGGELSPKLMTSAALQLVFARALSGQQKVLFTKISTAHIRIIASNIGTVVDNGIS